MCTLCFCTLHPSIPGLTTSNNVHHSTSYKPSFYKDKYLNTPYQPIRHYSTSDTRSLKAPTQPFMHSEPSSPQHTKLGAFAFPLFPPVSPDCGHLFFVWHGHFRALQNIYCVTLRIRGCHTTVCLANRWFRLISRTLPSNTLRVLLNEIPTTHQGLLPTSCGMLKPSSTS